MNDSAKSKAVLVYGVIQGVVIGATVYILQGTVSTVIAHGNTLSAQETSLKTISGRIDHFENHGSSGLESFRASSEQIFSAQDRRFDKLENAVITLQGTPGELKTISARLDNLKDGQCRIERSLEQHMQANTK